MKKKKEQKPQVNYLDMIPSPVITKWQTSEDGIVTLFIENKGAFHKVAQVVFRKPKYTQVHLDAMGSFIWPHLDGKKTVDDIAQLVKAKFGEEAEPLYPRIAKYFQILESYQFVQLSPKK